jgi:hypothetical protein
VNVHIKDRLLTLTLNPSLTQSHQTINTAMSQTTLNLPPTLDKRPPNREQTHHVACMTQHMAQQQRGRLDAHVCNFSSFGGEGSPLMQRYLAHHCHRCRHNVCPSCCVLNRYGDVRGDCGWQAFWPVSYRLLYTHARWCAHCLECVLGVVDRLEAIFVPDEAEAEAPAVEA